MKLISIRICKLDDLLPAVQPAGPAAECNPAWRFGENNWGRRAPTRMRMSKMLPNGSRCERCEPTASETIEVETSLNREHASAGILSKLSRALPLSKLLVPLLDLFSH